jgi:hypothetical protein
MWKCATLVQVGAKDRYSSAVFRLAFNDAFVVVANPLVDLQSLKDDFAERGRPRHRIVLDAPINLLDFRVWFHSDSSTAEGHASLVMVELWTLLRMTAAMYGAANRTIPK